MRGKLLFITGGLVGYVLGARAGRKRYEQIAAAATELWNAKPVQRRVTEARDFALEAVGDVPSQLLDAGKKAYAALQDKAERKAGRTSTTSAARTAAAVKVAKAEAKADMKPGAKSRQARTAKAAPTAPTAPAAPAATASDFTESTEI